MDENAHPPELFGPDGSVALMRRGAALWTLLRDNPRYAFYGRAIALCDPREDTADVLAAIAGLVGAAVANFLPKARADALFADLEGRGFTTDRHEHFWGGAAAHEASRRLLRDHALPADLSVVALDGDSPRPLVAEAAALCQACGVMPPPGATLRGLANPGITLVAVDGSGRPVATAASYAMHHKAGPHPDDVFWGLLATREDRRGARIAPILGARVIVHMWETGAARGFMTGVRRDNPASRALCQRLGIADSDWIYAWCLSAERLGRKGVTK